METLKAHFDGYSIVLDEPATLAVGQPVRVLVEDFPGQNGSTAPRKSRFGFAKGMFEIRPDFSDPLDEFAEYR